MDKITTEAAGWSETIEGVLDLLYRSGFLKAVKTLWGRGATPNTGRNSTGNWLWGLFAYEKKALRRIFLVVKDGGGYLGAFSVQKNWWKNWPKPGLVLTTFGGNPVIAAAALCHFYGTEEKTHGPNPEKNLVFGFWFTRKWNQVVD